MVGRNSGAPHMRTLFVAALMASVPALAQAQAYDPIFGAPPARPAATPPAKPSALPTAAAATAPRAGQSGCGYGRTEPPVGPRPASYTWTELWPSNSHCYTYGMGDLQFPEALAALKAFDNAAAVGCQECEGGRSFDTWPNYFIAGFNADKRMAALKADEKLTWKGKRLAGEITLIGEQPIGRFPCRQYRWVMRGAAGKVAATRTSLQCRNDLGNWFNMF